MADDNDGLQRDLRALEQRVTRLEERLELRSFDQPAAALVLGDLPARSVLSDTAGAGPAGWAAPAR